MISLSKQRTWMIPFGTWMRGFKIGFKFTIWPVRVTFCFDWWHPIHRSAIPLHQQDEMLARGHTDPVVTQLTPNRRLTQIIIPAKPVDVHAYRPAISDKCKIGTCSMNNCIYPACEKMPPR